MDSLLKVTVSRGECRIFFIDKKNKKWLNDFPVEGLTGVEDQIPSGRIRSITEMAADLSSNP
jgi:hypothetical protein